MVLAGSQHLLRTEVNVRTLTRLSLFILGVLMIGVALSPMFPVELLKLEPFRLAESDSAWRAALFVSFLYGTGRLLFLSAGRPKGQGRFCSLLLFCVCGSFASLMFAVAPEWNVLPTGALTGLSMFFIGWSGISLMWMQTFSGKVHALWIALKEEPAPKPKNQARFTEDEERLLPPVSNPEHDLFESRPAASVTKLADRRLSTEWRVQKR